MSTPDLSHIAEGLRGLAVPIGDLREDPENARRHPERNLDEIRKSLLKFGQRLPLVVQRAGMVVRAGNGRLTVARQLGWTHVAAVICDDEDGVAKAFGLMDNRSAELAEWDEAQLAKLLGEIQVDPALLDVTGFTVPEVKAILAPVRQGQSDPNDVPPPPMNPVTREGDLWLLGEHRLVCGDSRQEPVVAYALDGARATCVFTDPPYGVSIGAKNRMLQGVGKTIRRTEDIADDDLSPSELKERLLPAFVLVRRLAMADDCSLFMTAPQGGDLAMMMMMMMQEAGLPCRHVLIWAKNAPTFSVGRLDYDYQHEPILFTWGKRHKRIGGGEHQSSLWQVPKPRASEDHPTMKPVELYVNAYLNHTDPLDVVFEPYSGSGTAFIAASQTGRRCIGIELSPAYCDGIVKRWELFTGQTATRVPAPEVPAGAPDAE